MNQEVIHIEYHTICASTIRLFLAQTSLTPLLQLLCLCTRFSAFPRKLLQHSDDRTGTGGKTPFDKREALGKFREEVHRHRYVSENAVEILSLNIFRFYVLCKLFTRLFFHSYPFDSPTPKSVCGTPNGKSHHVCARMVFTWFSCPRTSCSYTSSRYNLSAWISSWGASGETWLWNEIKYCKFYVNFSHSA